MRRMNPIGWGHVVVIGALAVTVVFVAATPAAATNLATFASSGFGFNPSNLGALPVDSVDASVNFLDAGNAGLPGLAVKLFGAGDVCILPMNESVCRPSLQDPLNFQGPFSVLSTFQVEVVDSQALPGSFTLILSNLGAGYDISEVAIELEPAAVPNLDPVFNGSFTPFVHLRDLSNEGVGIIDDYIGWTVSDQSWVTFRYEVLTGPNLSGLPKLLVLAVPTVVVPEPGTALLVGLGLVGLCVGGARGRPMARSGEAKR